MMCSGDFWCVWEHLNSYMVGSSASELQYSTVLWRIQVTVVRSGDFKNIMMTLGAFKVNWVPNDDTKRLY